MSEEKTSRFGGQYMVQDSNHMSDISPATENAARVIRQREQSQSNARQQGDGETANRQQGGEWSQRN